MKKKYTPHDIDAYDKMVKKIPWFIRVFWKSKQYQDFLLRGEDSSLPMVQQPPSPRIYNTYNFHPTHYYGGKKSSTPRRQSTVIEKKGIQWKHSGDLER